MVHDQDGLFVGPDPVPSCLQRLSADEKSSSLYKQRKSQGLKLFSNFQFYALNFKYRFCEQLRLD